MNKPTKASERKTCFFCGRYIKKLHVLFDNKVYRFGEYCSDYRAQLDAVGPRFRPKFYVVPGKSVKEFLSDIPKNKKLYQR